jgi:pimeloyl-ACP methyl ester carboxylesterase
MPGFVTTDGVRLHYERSGDGEPLVVVHGSATTHQCFDAIVERLAEEFSVVAYDRRGHGDSGDAATWSFQREVDDLLELADHVADGGAVRLLGYSFGGAISLEAARCSGSPIQRLVVYEPPYGVDGLVESAPAVAALLDAGRWDDAARLFITETFHLSDSLVDAMTRHPMWDVTLKVLPNLARELPVVVSSTTPAPHPAFPPTRTLVAEMGGNPGFRKIADALEVALGSHTVTVPGAPHFAMATAPEQFASAVIAHLSPSDATDANHEP